MLPGGVKDAVSSPDGSLHELVWIGLNYHQNHYGLGETGWTWVSSPPGESRPSPRSRSELRRAGPPPLHPPCQRRAAWLGPPRSARRGGRRCKRSRKTQFRLELPEKLVKTNTRQRGMEKPNRWHQQGSESGNMQLTGRKQTNVTSQHQHAEKER